MAQTKQLTLEERQKNFDKHAAQITGPDALLVLKEKHGDIYFAIPDLETLYYIAVAIVTTRLNDGWYFEPEAPEKFDATLEEIQAIPSERIRTSMLKEYEEYQKALATYNDEKAEWDAINEGVKTKSGRVCWRVIRDHNDYEYEGWDTVHLSTAKDYLGGGL